VNRIEKLWFDRLRSFWIEAMQYGSYVARSGFLAFLFGGFIVGIYFYNKTLETLTDSFPYAWITTPVLLAALAISPIRTFLKKADTIFLLPAEGKMDAYFRKSRIYSFLLQAIIVVIACLAVWPLYRHCLGVRTESLLLYLIFLLCTKALQIFSSWNEGRLVFKRPRTQIQILRWSFSILVVYVLFGYGLILAAILLLLACCVILLLFKRASLHAIPWDYLIQAEQKHQAAHYLFFSWFVDVPQRATQVKHRILLSKWTRLYDFKPSNTYLYLYTKALLRSELFSILLRVTLLGILLLVVITNDTARAFIYIMIIYISSIQISSLEQQHRYAFWLHLYPLQQEWQVKALSKIIFTLLVFQCCTFSLILLMVSHSYMLNAFIFSLSCLLSALHSFVIYPRKLQRTLLQSQ
jgi:ABC-2 type transport system permease protein